jgi:RNA polymerase sigma-70 factor (ECF subfamily)
MDEVVADTECLLRRAGRGEPEAFERLFARHRAYLLRVVELRLDGRVRARIDPSDVVQETMMEAVRRLPDYLLRRPMAFRLWLRKTAQERLLMAERFHLGAARRSVRREVPLPDGSSAQLARQLLAGGSSPGQHLDRRERARQVHEAVARLSPADREILALRNLEGLSNQEAAEVLGVGPAAASRRYGRALLRLREELAHVGRSEDRS